MRKKEKVLEKNLVKAAKGLVVHSRQAVQLCLQQSAE
jgi:hypothetical protein